MRFERNFIFWIVAFLVFVGLLFLLHHILLPFVVGAALAYLLDPLANRLVKRGMSRLVAALVILLGFVIVFAGAFVAHRAGACEPAFRLRRPRPGLRAALAGRDRRSEPSVAQKCHRQQRGAGDWSARR
jgi:hypothetical protein